jgi:outer membrane protein
MAISRRAMAAMALGLALSAAPVLTSAAVAADATPVVVVDYDRLYRESLAGKASIAQLKGIAQSITNELTPEEKGLKADQATLAPRLQGKTPQQLAEALNGDKDLQKKYSAYGARVNAYLSKQALREQELEATQRKAISDVISAAAPSIEASMKAKNASIVIETGNTIATTTSVDITADVISRLNQMVKTVTVTKIDLTKQAGH